MPWSRMQRTAAATASGVERPGGMASRCLPEPVAEPDASPLAEPGADPLVAAVGTVGEDGDDEPQATRPRLDAHTSMAGGAGRRPWGEWFRARALFPAR